MDIITDIDIFEKLAELDTLVTVEEMASMLGIPDDQKSTFEARLYGLDSSWDLDRVTTSFDPATGKQEFAFRLGAGGQNALAEHRHRLDHEARMLKKASKDHKLAIFGSVTGLIGAITGLIAILK